jgi:hypothetical protein
MRDGFQPPKDESPEGLVRAIADANTHLPLVAKTRRAIRVANDSRRERGERERHHMGITLFVFGAILLMLAPALWGSIDDLLGGEHFGDLPTQVTLLSIFLVLAVAGALVVVWRGRSNQEEFRQDH